jgi:hypothetical protein
MSHGSGHTHETFNYFPVPLAPVVSNEPLAVQYSQPMSPAMTSYSPYAALLTPTTSNFFGTSDADRILDEAVEELFLHSDEAGEIDGLADFVQDWNPARDFGSPQDDAQLGYLLDKLLED